MAKFCSNCGIKLDSGAKFCPECGSALLNAAASENTDKPLPKKPKFIDIEKQKAEIFDDVLQDESLSTSKAIGFFSDEDEDSDNVKGQNNDDDEIIEVYDEDSGDDTFSSFEHSFKSEDSSAEKPGVLKKNGSGLFNFKRSSFQAVKKQHDEVKHVSSASDYNPNYDHYYDDVLPDLLNEVNRIPYETIGKVILGIVLIIGSILYCVYLAR